MQAYDVILAGKLKIEVIGSLEILWMYTVKER